MNRLVLFICAVLLGSNHLYAQTDYSNRQRLGQRVSALSKNHPNYAKTTSLAKTVGGSDIWMITIGTGQVDSKPAIAVVGGVEGKHLLGVELAIGFAENLLANAGQENVRKLLETQTFYVFPNMSPDATEQYFANLQYERSGNASSVDADRDGRKAEDGYEDLNGDGKITLIRVADGTGNYIVNPDEPRSVIKADQSKGQVGQFLVYSEGIDNDKDGQFNENGEEGIHFNKNSTYNYKPFLPGTGEHPVSEVENRALFDFLYDAFNVYTVVTFGPVNNLMHPYQVQRTTPQLGVGMGPRGGVVPKVTTWSETDVKANEYASSVYKEILGIKDAPKVTAGTGDFSEWAYYHYGRLSFSTPGWWVPKSSDDPVADYLKWAGSENISNTFVDWTEVQHPDFPGKKVEVGGVHPFVLHNPPFSMVGDLVSKHTDFVTSLAEMAPFIELADLKTERIDNGLTRVTVKVHNTGLLPTLSQIGIRSYFLKAIAVRVNTNGNQKVVSGRSVQTIKGIDGRGHVELTWLIQGTGKLTIEAGSPNTGSDQVEVSL